MVIVNAAQAYWNQRLLLSNHRDRILKLIKAVGRPIDLSPAQWAQLMTFTLEFAPDMVLELGRGYGNSTCAFTQAANILKPGSCKVLSLCLSDDWKKRTLPALRRVVPDTWFNPLQVLRTNILTFDYKKALAGHGRILVFWDAHGYDIAEYVLGGILPELVDRPHVVIMHDLLDARYLSKTSSNSYGSYGLWRGNDWSGPRLRIGNIDSRVEQTVAIIDFATRNKLPLHSASHSIRKEIGEDANRANELRELLGNELFALDGHWFWFSLNEIESPFTFPNFKNNKKNTYIPFKNRLKIAIKVLFNRLPLEQYKGFHRL